MNLLTIIVAIIIAIFTLRGYQKGFARSLASMISLIASLLLVFFLAPYVLDFLEEHTPVYDHVLQKCEQTFTLTDASKGKEKQSKETAAKKTAAKREDADKLLENLQLPELLKEMLLDNNTPEKYLELAAENFYDYVPKFMAHMIMNAISVIVTWIAVLVCMRILTGILGIVNYIPVIGGINRVLGLALGFVKGLIAVWIIFLIITAFSNSDIGRQLLKMISQSTFLREIYDNNLLLDFLQNTVKTIV